MTTAAESPIVAPATGVCQWLEWDAVTRNRWLRITVETQRGSVSREYEVERDTSTVPYVYRLYTLDLSTFQVITYTVQSHRDPGQWTCTCGDASHRKGRQGHCKHIRSLQSALPMMNSGYTKGL